MIAQELPHQTLNMAAFDQYVTLAVVGDPTEQPDMVSESKLLYTSRS